ncbi:UbiA family prenyltransferase [Halogranum rubrum]|uniref:4-hydroxybenzoate polyprenyltransferase-like prenyltransferase n=1 Tax=Halogranum salarium B-1 TaxID=1210908 RepID=J3EU88_9EURY|nr:UbiA family prenyltransferase [Halogranum salarium]EJN57902.1 4-hydroxybenzoate polyprenyltransferase-like prenyltransferase [Halogranum salarium B-1]
MSDQSTQSTNADNVTPAYRTLIEHLFSAARRTKDALLFSSAYLVAIALAESVTVLIALSLPANPAPLVVGLVTFAVYMGDRLADVDTDEVSNPTQSAFVRRHETPLSVLSAAAYGLALAIALFGGPMPLAITLLPGAFWVLYASEWLPEVGTYFQRLKEVLVLNTSIVSLAWAISLVFLPLAFVNSLFTPAAAVVFVYFFLDSFVNTEIPNVHDRFADEAIGVSTLPVVFGVARTRQILYGINLALVALVTGALVRGVLSTPVSLALLGGLGYTLVVTAFVGRTTRHTRLAIAGEAKAFVVVALFALATVAGL